MKTVDVNERTLEQEKQYLKKTSEIVRIEAVCFAIALILLMVVETIPSVSDDGIDTSLLFWVKLIFLPFQAAAAIVVSNFVTRLFKEIENGDTPFRYSIADKMKGLSDAVMVCGVIFALPQFVNQIICIFTDLPDKTSNSAGVIMLGGVFLGLVFKALSYIFGYGCKLQQESDETL
ncbi:MAG: DUF2975 domain-containing protein [Ruminiclostridium sp.]|nr:DUF2975 domain-containing protein [Ruminiclostridium sp.]